MIDQDSRKPVQIAEDYVRAFKQGVEFAPPSNGLFQGSTPNAEALDALEYHLLNESDSVRGKIVELLSDVGIQCADVHGSGILHIKDSRIIAILSRAGLSRADDAREMAMSVLRRRVLQTDLTGHGQFYAKALEEAPSSNGFLLIAKAKVPARVLVEQLAQTDEWRHERSALVARAALGDAAVVARFMEELEVAKTETDPMRFESAINSLSLTGTAVALKGVSENLRTALIDAAPMARDKSMRLVVLDGLVYNYPDHAELYPASIVTESDYTAAERFCEREFGTVYNEPKPPFMTYRGYPSPGAGER